MSNQQLNRGGVLRQTSLWCILVVGVTGCNGVLGLFGAHPPGVLDTEAPDTEAPDGDIPELATCVSKPTIAPLFAEVPPVYAIVEARVDGSLLTRGAGRVRGRHENEPTFNPFHDHYFENRSYAFEIEDHVAAGESRIVFRYLPVHAVSEYGAQTNLRLWKIYGNGNVFHSNVTMTRLSLTELEFEVTRNAREDRAIQSGDLLEFEFGIFIAGNNAADPEAIEGRTAYYTDTFRYRVGVGGLTDENRDSSVGALGPVDDLDRLGGATTIPFISETTGEEALAFSQMALNIQQPTIQRFLEGRRLFHTDFTTGAHSDAGNPVLTTHLNQAGPLLNQTSCTSCHVDNGPGRVPANGEALRSMVVKTFGDGDDENGAARLDPHYGRQLQDRSTTGAPEGRATLAFSDVPVTFDDGTLVMLRRPTLSFEQLAHAAPERFSVRLARRMIGLGLLEAVPEDEILARADEGDCDGNGISGKPNVVIDPNDGAVRLGRFGWKAAKASLTHQVSEALLVDIGVTTRLFPSGECPVNDTVCFAGGAPEVGDIDLDRLVTYVRTVGVPPRRHTDDAQARRGEELFRGIGCTSCHADTLHTGANHPSPELRGQTIHPFSDLLLHDMGADLADQSDHDGFATASEWRTPPLWGIGLVDDVVCGVDTGGTGCAELGFLHDGRARTPLEAVLWHGGEAAFARAALLGLSVEDRQALAAFLESL